METNSYRLVMVLRAATKITQMMGRSGNELLINRSNLLYRGDVVQVPGLSSNSMRHAAIREPGGMWLIDQYELSGRLNKGMLRLLTNGGNNATKSGGAESLGNAVAMRQHLPLLGLMGCGMPDGPKHGSLKVSDAVLLCDESRAYAEDIAGEILELPEYLRAARTCVGKWTSYRHDPVGHRPELLANPDEDSDHSGMIFGGEAIIPGALFVCEIRLEDATPVELGALLWSLQLWQYRGGIVGGMSARGNGSTRAMLYADEDIDFAESIDAYTSYALASRDAAVAWLEAAYAPPSKEPKGKGKPKQKELIA